MIYNFSIVFAVFSYLFSALPVFAMDYSSKAMKMLEADIKTVYQDATKDDNVFPIIGEAGKRILDVLGAWPENLAVPEKLLKAAAASTGQFCYFSPYSLQFIEYIILPYLKNGSLTYEDLKTPHCTYTFGLKYSRDSLDPNMLMRMRNGQVISGRYHLNYSVFFNRLLSEFNGSFLLIGGGENCECENSARHPKEHFYRVDIDNSHLPDIIINAVYLPHLYTFPEEKFDFIWFEHCSVPEMFLDSRVFEQYFRFTKPGALFLYQTNFKHPGLIYQKFHEENILEVIKIFAAYNFAVLESKEYSTTREGKSESYQQIIAMKPLLAKETTAQFSGRGPEIKINRKALVKPNPDEQASGLWRAKVLSGQLKLVVVFSAKTLNSWLPENKRSSG